jgi:hypothetical protein
MLFKTTILITYKLTYFTNSTSILFRFFLDNTFLNYSTQLFVNIDNIDNVIHIPVVIYTVCSKKRWIWNRNIHV